MTNGAFKLYTNVGISTVKFQHGHIEEKMEEKHLTYKNIKYIDIKKKPKEYISTYQASRPAHYYLMWSQAKHFILLYFI